MSDNVTLLDALTASLLGLIIVFFVLVLILAVILIMTALLKSKKTVPHAREETEPAEQTPDTLRKSAPGSAGGIKLYDTPERDAAMIMAIVADKMRKPLNELRFVSIKRID